jgi:hypothetical protein
MRPVETIPGMGRGRIKENDGGDEFKYVRTWYSVRTFVDATMYPQKDNFKKKKEKSKLNPSISSQKGS